MRALASPEAAISTPQIIWGVPRRTRRLRRRRAARPAPKFNTANPPCTSLTSARALSPPRSQRRGPAVPDRPGDHRRARRRAAPAPQAALRAREAGRRGRAARAGRGQGGRRSVRARAAGVQHPAARAAGVRHTARARAVLGGAELAGAVAAAVAGSRRLAQPRHRRRRLRARAGHAPPPALDARAPRPGDRRLPDLPPREGELQGDAQGRDHLLLPPHHPLGLPGALLLLLRHPLLHGRVL